LAQTAKALKEKEASAREKMQAEVIQANRKALFDNPNTPFIGAKKPTVYMVEFFDYQCGHCKNMKGPIDALVKANPGLRVSFIEFPIFGKNSEAGARVALAANMQGKYWPVHEALLAAGNPMTESKALGIAKKQGLNMGQLKKDMASEQVTKTLVQTVLV